MLSEENNNRLTRVENDAVMGRFLRENFWVPFSRTAALKSGAAPTRIRVIGRDLVAFRAPDGRVALLNEACPHRRASLALARVEGCALRCIFHGWKIDVEGHVVDVPSEGTRASSYGQHVKVRHYPTFEDGGLIWAWLGSGEPRPKPQLPTFGIPQENYWLTRSINPCNWFQGVEGTVDSVHVQTLHDTWIRRLAKKREDGNIDQVFSAPPRYEVEEVDYGLRAAAIRDVGDGESYVRVTEYMMPFVSINPGTGGEKDGQLFIIVPIDDESHMLFWGPYCEDKPFPPEAGPGLIDDADYDVDNLGILPGPEQRWGQDRAAMENGHFSGFAGKLLDEDIAVQISMGPITDRTQEHLCQADLAIARLRQMMLNYLDRFERGEPIEVSGRPRPIDIVAPRGFDWRSGDPLPIR